MATRLQILTDAYNAYVDTYRLPVPRTVGVPPTQTSGNVSQSSPIGSVDETSTVHLRDRTVGVPPTQTKGDLPPMMALKLFHTMKVVEAAEAIAAGEGFDARTTEDATAAALLHDTGRYEQLRVYNTFRDSDSVDHAVYSHDIVKAKGWLDGWPVEDRDAILAAVLYHNRRDLPENLDPLTKACSQTVRDADKLDIFRVLEDQIAKTDWRHDATAFWNLPTTKSPNPVVAQCIRDGQPVDYQAINSLADFVLIQVGWMVNGLYYVTSRRLCAARGHLAYRRRFLHQLTDDPVIDELCDLAERKMV